MQVYIVKFRANKVPIHIGLDEDIWTVASFSCRKRAMSFMQRLKDYFISMEIDRERIDFDWDRYPDNEVDLFDKGCHVASELRYHGKACWAIPRCPTPFIEVVDVLF